MVTFAEILPPYPSRMWMLCQQMNVTHAVTAVPIGPEGFAYWTPERIAATKVGERPWDFYPILYMTQRFADAGLTVDVIESSPPMDRARLGLPGRDEEIDDVCTMLQSMGAAGIPVWCYNWMAQFNWQRTSLSTRGRGGALVSSFDYALVKDAPLTPAGNVSEEHLWETLQYFLEKVVPVAEKAGVKLAMHPDDPPLSPIRGVGRIMRSLENFDRLLDLVPSPHNGITFCQGNFALMTPDIPAAIRHSASETRSTSSTSATCAARRSNSPRSSTMRARRTCWKRCGPIWRSASMARCASTMRRRWRASRTTMPATKSSAASSPPAT